ncbi:DUF4430 domain-containing protein [Clostridium sp. MSJ-8]|uniref:DUF4430 domain-containing protein n=1 Tax=Clostridium sp. MSJ-8 TaxID=2841510 RepID=UPI001C0EDD69|nr:DUF4430 domain-containing protein [Clostridium sp. MSJ-8]MBU5487073.1 DUF4430 domain-containing protein [Clostridium sp. MSJ-8]
MKKQNNIRKILSVMLTAVLLFTFIPNIRVNATEDGTKEIVLAIEKFTLGQGYVVEPMLVEMTEDETVAEAVVETLGEDNIKYTGSIDNGFYLASLYDGDDSDANVPQFILDQCGSIDERSKSGWLGEFDYTFMAGWMYAVNSKFPNFGMANCIPENGDVVRLQFTVYGYGMDLGGGYDGGDSFNGSYIDLANKDGLTKTIAKINSASNHNKLLKNTDLKKAYDKAYDVLENMESTQEEVDSVNNTLVKLLEKINGSSETIEVVTPSTSVNDAINNTAKYMLNTYSELSFGTGAGEWTALCLSRSGVSVPDGYLEKYYENVANTVSEKKGVLHKVKYTEYSRAIIGLTSIGKDPRNVAGYDLTSYLSDFNSVKKQGLNGPVFALIALNTHNYEIVQDDSVAVQTTRDMLVDYILGKEIPTGGWALSGSKADPDMTAMTLQALAPYKNDEKVKPYIDRGLTALSELQENDGGYTSWGSKNVESTSQVLVALTELGIDPAKDTRFIKSGNWLVSSIMDFYCTGGGFKHTLDGSVNAMATDQAMYALIAYDRFTKNKTSLYNMTDVNLDEKEDVTGKVMLSTPEIISSSKDSEFNVGISIGSLPSSNTKLIEGVMQIPDGVEVASMSVNNDTIVGGTLTYGVDSNNVLRFVYTNTSLENLNVIATSMPAELFRITLKNTRDFDNDEKINIKLDELGCKEDSNGSDNTNYDISKAESDITAKAPISMKARELYVGDGSDLIPANKKAVAVEVANLEEKSNLIYKDTQFYYSSNLSNKNGVDTYIAIVDKNVTLDDLNNAENYNVISSDSLLEITFGDTNSDKIINAQDALDTISAWVRKTEAPDDIKILEMNVTGDSRINTNDALGIMEYYVNGAEFGVLNK